MSEKIIGKRNISVSLQTGRSSLEVMLTSALPLGRGAAITTGVMRTDMTNGKVPQKFAALNILFSGEVFPDGVRSTTTGNVAPSRSIVEKKLQSAREALRDWENSQRSGKWDQVATARQRLKRALEGPQ